MFIMAINVVANQPPERLPTGILHSRAKTNTQCCSLCIWKHFLFYWEPICLPLKIFTVLKGKKINIHTVWKPKRDPWVKKYLFSSKKFSILFSQSVSLTQYVVLSVHMSVRLFQLASESLRDIVARRRSDYCPREAIFKHLPINCFCCDDSKKHIKHGSCEWPQPTIPSHHDLFYRLCLLKDQGPKPKIIKRQCQCQGGRGRDGEDLKALEHGDGDRDGQHLHETFKIPSKYILITF